MYDFEIRGWCVCCYDKYCVLGFDCQTARCHITDDIVLQLVRKM